MTYRYLTIKVNGKTKLLHRHLMEEHLGRSLRTDEHVHHKNGDRKDNRIENLEVVEGLSHIREHAEERLIHPRVKTCRVCGKEFTPSPTKRKRAKTCSKRCADALRSITERRTKSGISTSGRRT